MDNNLIKLLLVEDNPGDARLIREMLADAREKGPLLLPSFQLVQAGRLESGLTYLAAEKFDVILLDLSLPDSQGFDTFARIHAHTPDVPIILLSGLADDTFALQAVQAGAQDYLAKGHMDGNLLVRTIRYAMERMRIQQELLESEERYRRLVELSPDGIVVHLENKIVFINTAGLKLLRASKAEEIIGRSILDLIHPDYKEIARKRVRQAAAGEITPALEEKLVRLDGSLVDVEVTGSPFIYQGEPAVQVVFRDISIRKRAAEELKQRAVQLAIINEIGSKVAAVLDLNKLLEMTAHLIQRSFDYHHVAIFLVKEQSLELKAVAGSYTPYFESRHIQQLDSGVNGWVASHGQKIVANDVNLEPRYTSLIPEHSVTQAELCLPINLAGQTVGVLDIQSPQRESFSDNDILALEALTTQVAVAIENANLYQRSQQEIEDRKRAEETLWNLAHRFRSLIENASDMIAILDDQAIFRYLAPSVTKLLGCDPEDMIGQKILQMIHPDDVSSVTEAMTDAFQHSGVDLPEVEYRLQHYRDGSWRTFAATFTNLLDNPTIQGLLVNAHDVTERKQAEQKVRTQARQQAAVAELGQHALVGDDLSELFDEAVVSVVRTLEVTHCLLLELLPDQQNLWVRAGVGALQQQIGQAEIELETALSLNYTLFYGDPLVIEDVRAEPRFNELPWLAGQEVISSVSVAIEGQEWPFGILAVYTDQQRMFTEDDIHFLQAIANVLATAAQRKQVEEALRASEERFRQVVTSITDHIYVTEITEDGRRLNRYISPVEALTGYSEEKFLTDWSFWPSSVIHPDDQAAAADHAARLAAGQSGETEYRLVRADGQVIWVRDSGRAVNEGNTRVIYGVVGDITQRKQYERELEAIVAVAAALRDVLTRTDALSVVLNQLLDLLDVKGAAIGILDPATGETVIEVAGGAWSGTIGLRTAADEGINAHILSTGQPYLNDDVLADSRLVHPDLIGDLNAVACVPLIAQVHPIGVLWVGHQRAITMNQVRLLTTIADIAANAVYRITLFEELQLANEELARERSLLAQRIRERTAELSAANAELARAARLKDEFLANMSHELRTPLNAILGMSEILRMNIYGTLNEKQLNALNHIEEGGRHLLDLINDILDLSKIEAGKLELTIGPVSVKSVCQSSLRFIHQMAQKKQIKLLSTIDESAEVIEADERRLKQILVNLLSNAVKFTPEGGQVGLELESDEVRNVLHLTVWDTGIGIAEEEMGRLFKPFVQIDSSLSRQYEGTGLGLSLVSRLVEMHGGGISVESAINQGSRFTISLPLQQGSIEHEHADKAGRKGRPAQTRGRDASASVQDHQPLILLAEDNQVNIITTRDFLRIKGYRVIVVRNGLEAIERTREERPDLILMDVQMPKMDGLEATRRIRAEADYALIPIIALTALAMPGDRERCLQAGVTDYLSKPVGFNELVKTIEMRLQEAKLRAKQEMSIPVLSSPSDRNEAGEN